jgi:O-antigen/teichoic acid export membrane protein
MLLRHSALYLVARGLPGLVSLLALTVYTRLLSPEQYGQYALVGAWTGLAGVVLFFWLRAGLVRFFAVYEGRQHAFLSSVALAFAGLVALVAAAAAAGLAVVAPAARPLVLAGVALLACHALFELQRELARAELAPVRYGMLGTASAVLSLVFGVALVLLGLGAVGALAGAAAGALVAVLPPLARQLRVVRLHLADLAILRQLLRYGAPLTAAIALDFVVASSDRLLIGWLLSEEAVGRYAVGYDLARNGVGVMLTIVHLAAYPLVVQAFEQRGPQGAAPQMERNLVAILAVGLPAATGLALVAGNIATVLLGAAFRADATTIIPVIAVAVVLGGAKVFHFDYSFQLSRRTGLQVWISGLAASLNVVLNLLWIPAFGIIGAAYATLVTYALALLLSLAWGRRVVPFPVPTAEIAKIALATAVMAATVWPLAGGRGLMWLIAQIAAGAVVYGLCLWLFDVANLRAGRWQERLRP